MRNGALILADKKKKVPYTYDYGNLTKPGTSNIKGTIGDQDSVERGHSGGVQPKPKAQPVPPKKVAPNKENTKEIAIPTIDGKYFVEAPGWKDMSNEEKVAFRNKAIASTNTHLKANGVKASKPERPKLTLPSEATPQYNDTQTVFDTIQNGMDTATRIAKETISPLSTLDRLSGERISKGLKDASVSVKKFTDSKGITRDAESTGNQVGDLVQGAINPSEIVNQILNIPSAALGGLSDIVNTNKGAGDTAMGALNVLPVVPIVNKASKLVSGLLKKETVGSGALHGFGEPVSSVKPLQSGLIKGNPQSFMPEPKVVPKIPPLVKPVATEPAMPQTTTTQKPPSIPKVPEIEAQGQVGSKVVNDLPIDKPVGDLVATANKVTNEIRSQVGLEGKAKVAPEKIAEWEAQAKDVNVDNLIEEIGNKPRVLGKHEELALGARLSGKLAEYDEAVNLFHEHAGKGNVPKSVSDNLDSLRGQVEDVITTAEKAGTEWGRSGVARQALIRSDYSTQGLIKRSMREAEKQGLKLDTQTKAYYDDLAERLKSKEAEVEDLKSKQGNHDKESYMPIHKLEVGNKSAAALESEFNSYPEKFTPGHDEFDPELFGAMYKHMEGRAPVDANKPYDAFGPMESHDPNLHAKWDNALSKKQLDKYGSGDNVEAISVALKDLRHSATRSAGTLKGVRRNRAGNWVGAHDVTFVDIEDLTPDLKIAIIKHAEMHEHDLSFMDHSLYADWHSQGMPKRAGFHPRKASEITGESMGADGGTLVTQSSVRSYIKELEGKVSRAKANAKNAVDIEFNENDLAQAKVHYNEPADVARSARADLDQMRGSNNDSTRRVKRVAVANEYRSIVNQIKSIKETPKSAGGLGKNRQRGAVDLGPRAQLLGLYGQLGWNYAKQGYMTIVDIAIQVTKVAKDAGHKISKQELVDAMDDIRLKRAASAAARTAKQDLKARLNLNKEVANASTFGKANAAKRVTDAEAKLAGREAAKNKAKEIFEAKKLAAKPNRLRGEIADMKRMIKENEFYGAKAEKAGNTDEVTKLLAEKARLNKVMSGKIDELGTFEAKLPKSNMLQDMAGVRGANKEARNKAKNTAKLNAQIDDLNYRINNWELAEVKGKPRDPADPDIAALRKERDTLQKVLNLQKDVVGDFKPAELVRDERSLARMGGQIRDLEAMIEAGDFYGTGVTRKKSALSDAVALKEYQLQQLRNEADASIDALGTSRGEKIITEAFNLTRGLKLGLDMGVLGRQGLDVLYTNPKAWVKGFSDGIKSLNKVEALRINQEYLNDPEIVRWVKDGLAIDKLGHHGEEGFASTTLKWIPGHAPLERFHVATQNGMRVAMAKYMSKAGDLTEIERKGVADLIGAMTGRGNLIKAPGKLLNAVFTAPKMYAGHAEVMTAWMNPKYSPLMGKAGKSSKAVRAIVARRTLGRVGMAIGLKAFADKLGWDYSLNPDDSDFLKLRKGDVVIDIGGGYTPYYRAFFASVNDQISKSRKYSTDDISALQKLSASKLSPMVSGVAALRKGMNFVGEPRFRDPETGNINLKDSKSWMEVFGAITANDVFDMYMEQDKKFKDSTKAQKATYFGAAFIGFGASSFDDKSPRRKGFEDTVMGKALIDRKIPIDKRTDANVKALKEANAGK